MTEAPERRIVGFHQDEDGWWVAELECGHGRHMRHDPPWHVREWVATQTGRADMIGRPVPCGKCPAAPGGVDRSADRR